MSDCDCTWTTLNTVGLGRARNAIDGALLANTSHTLNGYVLVWIALEALPKVRDFISWAWKAAVICR